MDEKPFFEFNVIDIKDNQIEELKKFHKSYFDVGKIQNTASELKYMNELKALINIEFQSPSEGFVRHFAKQIYQGMLTARLIEQFSGLTKKSIQQYINDLITESLNLPLKKRMMLTKKFLIRKLLMSLLKQGIIRLKQQRKKRKHL
jgi:hypothetical protein